MVRRVRIAAIVFAALAAAVAAALCGAYAALQRTSPFYPQALAVEPRVLETAGRELESRATALYNDARRPGEWQAAFTAEQINGWLATQLAEVYPDVLPANIADPRVAIGEDVLTLGFRTRRGGVETVITADANVSIAESGAVAVRLLSVRAGAMPLPVMPIADELSHACQELALPIRWTQDAGRPVALVDFGREWSSNGRRIQLESAELRDGTLRLAGQTLDTDEQAD